MSFVKQNINLNGNLKQPVHRYKFCDQCETKKPPEGGVQVRPTRWVCAACWVRKATPRKK
ncbi:hypothetical protein UFOVP312_13 [uncultured Caudovirales phage]|uniref:Uncharacterized protein n=1 Tax=uncultured Caudovirales phage TaxID=2100421 RepID=A0A6J5LS15_9CAUD|nr:hypothetical protein UFOVP312_13 [uncultured Caudovirales phage]